MSDVKEINGRKYIFKKFGFKESIKIKDKGMTLNAVTQKTEFLLGTMQAYTIFYALKSGLKNDKGEEIETTEENFFDNFPPEDFDKAYLIAQKYNSVSEKEKNASSGQSATV